MTLLRLARPLWIDGSRAKHARSYRPLHGTVSSDVTIVGGGITGATLAWRLSAAGVSVVVLDSGRVARGSTAASTALLMQEPDEDFLKLRKRYGARSTVRIWQASRKATREFIETIRDLRFPAGLRTRDSIYYTLDEEEALGMKREHAWRGKAGASGAWLNHAALHRATGIQGVAAIRTHGNAEVDPVAVTLGFLDAAATRGAAIFERSRVRRITVEGEAVRVKTAHGEVLSDHVIVATGYATPDFKPLAGRFRMLNTYVVATRPVAPSIRRRIGLSDVMIWDTERPYHYARWTNDGRLIMGGADRPQQSVSRRARVFPSGVREVRAYFERLLPALSEVETGYAWEGLFATTPDGLPYIGPHRRYPRHLFALGYGGNGMTFAFLAAKLITERLTRGPAKDEALFAFNRNRTKDELEKLPPTIS